MESNSMEQNSLHGGSGAQWVHPLNVFLMEVVARHSLVVWSCPPGALAMEPPEMSRLRSAAACALLESDLLMAATCVGLVMWQGECVPWTEASVTISWQQVQGMLKPDPACLVSVNLLQILGKFSVWAKTSSLYVEATGSRLGGLTSW